MAARVAGKVGIVTGAAHGLGAALAMALAREGASVAAVDVCRDLPPVPYPLGTEEELHKVVKDIEALGRRAIAIKCDVGKASEVEKMVKTVINEFGKIDILVNNAGVVTFTPFTFWEITEEAWDLVIDVNLKGTFLCCKYAIPHMIAQKWGRIVNIGSIDVREGAEATHPHYCASKGGVHTMTLAMARGVGAYNITVNCIHPGGIMTPMFQWAGDTFGAVQGQTPEEFYAGFNRTYTIMDRQLYLQDIANFMMWLVSEEAWTVTGEAFFINGGQKAHMEPPSE